MVRVWVPLSKGVKKRAIVSLVLIGLLSFFPVLHAAANQNPSGCNSNRFNISIVKDHTEVYKGQTLTYTVTATNVNFNSDVACDITGATIDITLPNHDGTPTGQVVNLVTNQDFPAGTVTTLIGTASYVVDVDDGVVDIVAEARAEGTLHDAPVNHSALIVKTLGTSVVAAPAPTTPGTTDTGTGADTPRLPNTGVRED
jgi:hypothetical protein